MTDIGGCIERGVSWNGHDVVPGRVVMLCAEGAGDYRYRLEVYRQHNKLKHEQLFRVLDAAPDLLDPKEAKAVALAVLDMGGCDILIVDTVSATFSGDERGSDMNAYLRNIRLIQRKLNCCVWLISHRGKVASKGMRGWSGQKAAFDVEVEITREGDEQRVATVTKMKGGAAGAQFPFKLKFVPLGKDAKGEEYGSCVVEYLKPTARVHVKKRTKRQREALCVLNNKFQKALTPLETIEDAILSARGFKPEDILPYHRRDVRALIKHLVDLDDVAAVGDLYGLK